MKAGIALYFKGIAMGAADAVPGVSGGTIAFISGIYEELVRSIRSFDAGALKLLARFRIRPFWSHVNGRFLAVLLAGIVTSLMLLSRIILHWLAVYPELLWAFFFGLIIASALVVGRKIEGWPVPVIAGFLLGGATGYWITVATPAVTPDTLSFVFFSGMIAICAMILPGISGSFILVLLSKYEYVLGALRDFRITVMIAFSLGAAVGLLSFSHLLNWLLRRYHDITIAALTGLMLGSLNKVWPWKWMVETVADAEGAGHAVVTRNLWPVDYLAATGRDPHLLAAVALALIGFGLVYLLDRATRDTGRV